MTYQLSYSESIDTADGASCCSIISVEICQLWMGGQLRSLIPPHLPWLTLSSVIGAKWVSSRNPSSTLTPASISRGLPNVSLRRWSLSVRDLCLSCARSPPLPTSWVFQIAGSQKSFFKANNLPFSRQTNYLVESLGLQITNKLFLIGLIGH